MEEKQEGKLLVFFSPFILFSIYPFPCFSIRQEFYVGLGARQVAITKRQ